ncbi:MAG TPA: HAD family hydrolase [Acidimicrobiales bacterium]
MFDVIGLDGDDTLWHNEALFSMTQERFAALLADYVEPAELARLLIETERRNLVTFGYGVKGFTLSMIETAIEVSDRKVGAEEIETILGFARDMLRHPVELLEGARAAVTELAERHRLVLVTKGDLFDQESKVARSGLGELFWRIEIVSEKDQGTYRRLLERWRVAPQRFCMVGNSLRSDVLPVVAVGGTGVHVPYPLLSGLEEADPDEAAKGGWHEVGSLAEVPALLDRLAAAGAA